jgi:flagellar motor switch protein FliM
MSTGTKARGETLSQAEIESLLATLPAEDGTAVAAPPPRKAPGKQVRTWDFRKPDKFSKDHMRSLLVLHQNFARIASSALTGRMRAGVTIKVTSVEQGLYEEYLDLLPAHSIANVVSLHPLEGNIIFEFQPQLAMVMLDRMLGGSGTTTVENKRDLTDIELALVRNLVRTLLEGMREAWLNLAETAPVIEEISTSPHLVQVAAPTDIVVIVLLEVQVGTHLGTISLCIPHLLLEPLMQRLSAQVWIVSNRRGTATPEMRARITDGLRGASLTVSAVLGEASITIDEILRLQVGDVLLLGQGAVHDTRVTVVGRTKFRGVPGVVGGRMAVQITDVEGAIGDDDRATA